jgi:glycosyltransferase involved in cell wall biosynthesis
MRAKNDYGLAASQIAVVGIFGEIEVPQRDSYRGGKDFLFVSTNFEAKGGRVVLPAFREVRKQYPEATLILVGDRPADIKAEPGVTLVGFLRKEVPHEQAQLREILGRTRALVHPTRSDVCPLIIVEAGYFGCPAISSRRFAIPELIDHEKTGLLIENPSRVDEVVGAMTRLLEHEDAYRDMRRAAWAKAHDEHSKARFEERLLSHAREQDTPRS